jgi:Na+/melibiose symporter-like transporter
MGENRGTLAATFRIPFESWVPSLTDNLAQLDQLQSIFGIFAMIFVVNSCVSIASL